MVVGVAVAAALAAGRAGEEAAGGTRGAAGIAAQNARGLMTAAESAGELVGVGWGGMG